MGKRYVGPKPDNGDLATVIIYPNAAAVDAVVGDEKGYFVTTTPASFLGVSDSNIAYDGELLSLHIETFVAGGTVIGDPDMVQIARFVNAWNSEVYEYKRYRMDYDSAWEAWVMNTPSDAVLRLGVYSFSTTATPLGFNQNTWDRVVVRLTGATAQSVTFSNVTDRIGMETRFEIINGQQITLNTSGGATINGSTSSIILPAGTKRFTSILTAAGEWRVSIEYASPPAMGGLSLVKLTQAAYTALGTKDPNTVYYIVG